MASARGLAIGGGLALAGWVFLPRIPFVFNTHSTNGQIHLDGAQAHALCNSTLGQLGQAMSATVANTCSGVDDFYNVMMVLGILGAALLALALVAYVRTGGTGRDPSSPEKA